jgi:hypothetical protein
MVWVLGAGVDSLLMVVFVFPSLFMIKSGRKTRKYGNMKAYSASRKRNSEEFAGGSRGFFFNFAVTRDGGNFSISGVFPNGMVSALPRHETAVIAEMAFEIGQFHAGTS